MVECGLPKAETRVRFPSPAPIFILINEIKRFVSFWIFKNASLLTLSANKSIYVCRCQDVILGLFGAGAR